MVVVQSPEVAVHTGAELRQLWEAAFGDCFSNDDAEHTQGGVYALTRDADLLVGQASVVPASSGSVTTVAELRPLDLHA